MDGVARSRCQIRVLGESVGGKAAQIGCGVIVGPTLAITCTHVVTDALGLGPDADLERREVRVRIPDDEPIDIRMRVVRAWPADPQHPDLDGIERFHDICLLEPHDGSFPASDGSRVASICTDLPESGAILVGSGTSVEHRDVALSCELGDPIGSRSMLTSPQSDKAIRPGCSGAGLFQPGRGLVGMVSEGQGKMAGFMIQGRVLAEVLGRAAIVTAPAAATKRADVHSALFRKLDALDRQPQEFDFDEFLQISQRRRSGLVCTLGGFDTDQPYLCRDRLARDAFKLAGCAPEIEDRALPVELPIPSLSEMSADDALRRLKNGLKRELGAAGIEPGDLVAKLEERSVPLIAYSRLDEDSLKSRNTRDLIRRWAEFIDAATRGRIALKFIHFLVIHLRGPGDTKDEDALAKRYRAAVKALNGEHGESEEAPILRIQLLKRVASNDVQDWVREAGVALTLDRDLVTTIQIRAAAQFPDDSRPRFAEVAAWIRQLNLQAEQEA